MKPYPTLAICTHRRLTDGSPSCGARHAALLAEQLEHALQHHGLPVTLIRSDCLGRCESGPTLRLAPHGVFFSIDNIQGIAPVIDWLTLKLG